MERIADSLTLFDWNAFSSTLIATLVGALVAALISISLYRHEGKARDAAEVDAAVITLMRAIQSYSQDYRKFIRALDARASQPPLAVQQGWTDRVVVVDEPDRTEIDTAVETLIVLTRTDDRVIAERTREVLYQLNFLKDSDRQAIEYAAVRRVLVAWRAGKRSTAETLSGLAVVDERRRLIIEGKPETDLPAPPEPYAGTAV
ncbi:hypothetical protein [Cryobacterium sp. TMT1-66-1]|uniref:hypothetical protein n=1 Tax=Cryobacterium sp. TMT1-66-1 TaxID=1259242 RepID=UPI00106C3033|nr:hypothetical protein [Cryobacterium sp. TMT1-66-1]TFD05971.1 hypothetical protein E3T29_11800 [Cryobacterium sp. TMT1-66-1]